MEEKFYVQESIQCTKGMKKRTEGHISQRSVAVIIVDVLRAKVIPEMQQQCACHEQNS